MRRKSKTKTKEPVEGLTQQSSDAVIDSLNSNLAVDNNTPNQSESQDDVGKCRHFWYVVYPESAPSDWVEQIQNTGLAFCVSPLHDRDINPDNTPKKPHWHVIVSWGNTTTYNSAVGLCKVLNCPRPQMLHNVTGAYRYHKHLDNPEKYQYEDNSVSYNGWVAPLDKSEVSRIKKEIQEMVLNEDIREYAELLIVCDTRGAEYLEVATNNTFYCERLCASYRHNPYRVLQRYYSTLPDGDLKDKIKDRIGVLADESND